MTRNKYCDVCGTELLRSRNRKQKDFSNEKKSKGKFYRKKKTLSILVSFILVGIIIPAVCVQLTRRAQFSGEITLITISINNLQSDRDELHLSLKVVSGDVRINNIHLYTYDRQRQYQSINVEQDVNTGQFLHKTFRMQKGQLEDMNHGFSLHIDYRFGSQWIKYFFG